jgi:hypothetical protein
MFESEGVLYRQVNDSYRIHYDLMVQSGLLEELTNAALMIRHDEVPLGQDSVAYKVLRPERIPFVSYPFEWSFSQLRDAALLTLDVQRRALRRGMSLKDASAYNVQFLRGKPILIDTLSLEAQEEGAPWVAYRQFCQHFLAPLSLMARRDIRFGQLFRVFIDGVPLDMASALLPKSSWLKPSALMHLHLHALAQRKFAGGPKGGSSKTTKISARSLAALIDSLESAIKALRWTPAGTEWGDYYSDTNYTDEASAEKQRLVSAFHDRVAPNTLWDLGANTGRFSRLASTRGISTVAFDIDAAAVEKNYRDIVSSGNTNELPLVLDLTNPSPAFGWAGQERLSVSERGPADLVQALAIVHHLAISNNVPLVKVSAFFAQLGRALVIEFVPKSDSQVQRLLASREDIFDGYTREGFEAAFAEHFTIEAAELIRGSERVLYLMRRKA